MRATSLGHAGILIETRQATIACDPWFVPAFFGSWFVFPRNDRLPPDVLAALEQPDFLYLSHLHGDEVGDPPAPAELSRLGLDLTVDGLRDGATVDEAVAGGLGHV